MFRAPFFVVLSDEKRGENSQKSRKIAQNRASGVFRACSKKSKLWQQRNFILTKGRAVLLFP